MKYITKKLLCLSCLSCASIGGIAVAANYPNYLGIVRATPKAVNIIPQLSEQLDNDANTSVVNLAITKDGVSYFFDVYNCAKGVNDTVIIGDGGYIRNTSAINGLSAISNFESNNDDNISFIIGGLDDSEYAIIPLEYFGGSDDASSFEEDSTSFMVKNKNGLTTISKLEFSYSCDNKEKLVDFEGAYYSSRYYFFDFESYGTSEYPYKIGTPNDLMFLSDNVLNGDSYTDTYFELIDDIEFDESTVPFEPIGDYDNNFNGHFDGDNYTITINYDGSDYSSTGLFSVLDSDAVIDNLIVNGTIYYNPGSGNIGGIAGQISGSKIRNCQSNINFLPLEEKGEGKDIDDFDIGSENDVSCLGGLVGLVEGECEINHCSFGGAIKVVSGIGIGGLAGAYYEFDGGSISNCVFDGIMSINCDESENIGGLFGEFYGSLWEGMSGCSLGDNKEFIYANSSSLTFDDLGNFDNNFIGYQIGYWEE